MLTAQPVNSRPDGRVDGDIVSRFATCCRALGISVYERQRPADLAAARSGFTELTRIAHDHATHGHDVAAGDVSIRALEAVRTATTAGVLQLQAELAPGALGFRYDMDAPQLAPPTLTISTCVCSGAGNGWMVCRR
jgi:hypothetical protein